MTRGTIYKALLRSTGPETVRFCESATRTAVPDDCGRIGRSKLISLVFIKTSACWVSMMSTLRLRRGMIVSPECDFYMCFVCRLDSVSCVSVLEAAKVDAQP